ncbi:GNAT family N-acetyltransferase [Streptomyces sp. DSM 3412]|uniref:GNAT family N-acetyltransferase n=1 Tax=Streptomyces gottesmaniae TaxID=3075518 RepID=A0ABU2YRZ9_9ACTN|nr:GNAT family N-acetyltransferase [Streptomyces sp. DSM 3412]MDT0566204.1 GNAT family N-acetyltransferase [Streptomyces sp. DSM 3412]
MSESSADRIVQRADAERLYEIRVDGRRVGLTAYRNRGTQRVFFHTEVDEAFTGQGLGAELVRWALLDVRESGQRIVPVCPYVAAYLKRHDEFADIADPVTPDVLTWLEGELR